MRITCTVCGSSGSDILDEKLRCLRCRSIPRQRAMARGVIEALRLDATSLETCGMDKSRYGIGISDWFYLAGVLAFKFNYANTWYHRFPKVDISSPPPELEGSCEFITCSDVLEHTVGILDDAIRGLHAMLKPGGCLIASVPIAPKFADVHENHPGLVNYRLEKDGERLRVIGLFEGRGEVEIANPIFHDGPGYTLEVRKFSLSGFRNRLERNGFSIVREIRDVPENAIPASAAPILIAQRPAA